MLLVQPADLLRWSPTGTAWDWYRARRAGQVKAAGARSAFGRVKAFRLLHDDPDAPAADRLRAELRAMGALESARPAEGDTAVVLLTDRTRTAWLAQWMNQLPADVLTVVATRIRLPDELGWLWRRQWIDFRHWDRRRLESQSLPQVPEALTRVRLPGPVQAVHHLLCALLALLLVAVGMANPDTAPSPGGAGEPHEPGLAEAVAALEIGAALGVWIALTLLARRLLRRRVHQARFVRDGFLAAAVASVLTPWALWRAVAHGSTWLNVALGIAFLVAMVIVFTRMRQSIAFWFPAPGAAGDATLTAGRNWRTLIWTSVYILAWSLLLRI